MIHGTCSRRKGFKKSTTYVTFIVCLVIFIIDIALFASSAGYYWLETVDHYATSVNLVVFLFFQLIVMVYMLPISELVKKVYKFGEEFPRLYLLPLKLVCPAFALFLAVMAVWNELKHPLMKEQLAERIISFTIFFTPIILTILIAIWNPFGKEAAANRERQRTQKLLNESNAEFDEYDDYVDFDK